MDKPDKHKLRITEAAPPQPAADAATSPPRERSFAPLRPRRMSDNTRHQMLVEEMSTWRTDELQAYSRRLRNGTTLQEWVDPATQKVYARYVMSSDGQSLRHVMTPKLQLH